VDAMVGRFKGLKLCSKRKIPEKHSEKYCALFNPIFLKFAKKYND